MLETNVSNFNCFGAAIGYKWSVDIYIYIYIKGENVLTYYLSTRIPTQNKTKCLWENNYAPYSKKTNMYFNVSLSIVYTLCMLHT